MLLSSGLARIKGGGDFCIAKYSFLSLTVAPFEAMIYQVEVEKKE
jgi:hypothetical protein